MILPKFHKANVNVCMKNGLQNGCQESSQNDYKSPAGDDGSFISGSW